MKKTVKIMLLFLIIFSLFSIIGNVQANSIQKISMDIFIEDNGDAKITENWECYTNEGTEVYHPYYNLGNSEIKDLTVSEGNRKYTTLSKWNVNGSLSSKANKCGINELTDGVELCWGISSYGSHTYTVKYTITNFVSELTDSQMIYWTLIPHNFSNTIGNVYIKIHCNSIIEDTIDVWGYGNYGGTAYVYDGYIEMQSDGSLASDEYMTILVKFPLGRFNCSNKLENNFDYYFQMAEEGSIKYNKNSEEGNEILHIWLSIGGIAVFLITLAVIATPKYNYGPKGRRILEDAGYYRDIPCEGDIFKAYYIGNKYGLLKGSKDILGAIILKWIKDSIISIEEQNDSGVFKKENSTIVLKDTAIYAFDNKYEKEIFNMLREASKDGYLENKEFEEWCKKNYEKILNWFVKILEEKEIDLIKQGYIKISRKRILGIFMRTDKTVTDMLEKEALELAGLKKYLRDYSLIHTRRPLEVYLFEEYLVFAQLMGMAKEVAKQFKDLYPNIIQESTFNSYDNIEFVNICTTRGINKAFNARSEARANSYSSGGGGFSSGGGGGGSFGGGSSGGGGFR